MTQRARHTKHEKHQDHQETDTLLTSSVEVPGRHAVAGRSEFLEFLGLTLAAVAFALVVLHPEACEALVHTLASGTARLVH
ncbi:hypothetical protein TUSST3_69050 [Streptomyces sp. TUS-ST3]|uniref:hypothetical protein n=1 Tax=Streptomyces sp. TUS-ST3 TaxID=3025591 RepID=UPI00235B40E2|nr:hypothetical protein [Streptomyces sp. TUS-ST3]GLP70284.1 hypothetical protein TUSST3_69050 [Streptomyces sp. TUS-ST3]